MGATPVTRYNVQRIVDDMSERAWNQSELAARAGVSVGTVNFFLSGKHRTAKTATRLAKALGHSVRRYLVASEQVSA